MSTFFLIRHGSCDHIGNYLAGRLPNIHLNEKGHKEVSKLSELLDNVPLDVFISSPIERALETAQILNHKKNLEIKIDHRFTEVDCGLWTGKTFKDLQKDSHWSMYNTVRSFTRIPGGESMIEIQNRTVSAIQEYNDLYSDKLIAIVSHGDPIKTILATHMGFSFDIINTINVDPASVSTLIVNPWGSKILNVNMISSNRIKQYAHLY